MDEYEVVGRWFEARYRGVCAVDPDHPIKKGDRVARIQRADNPMLPVSGVACSSCIRILPHA